MANTDIIVVEEDLVEQDGKIYRKSENGILVETGWDTLMMGFRETDLYRAENIVALRKDKTFSDIGIDINVLFNDYLNQETKIQNFNQMIIDELIRLEVDMYNLTTETEQFTSITNIHLE